MNVTGQTLILMVLATTRLTLLLTVDKITDPIRDRLLRNKPDTAFVSRLLGCPVWCASVWSAGVVTALQAFVPVVVVGLAVAAATVPLVRIYVGWFDGQAGWLDVYERKVNGDVMAAEAALIAATTPPSEGAS